MPCTYGIAKITRVWIICQIREVFFHQPSAEFLGYIISGNGFSMDQKKIQTIIEWNQPSSIKDVQCFLGFAKFYRIFIKEYSKIAVPLTRFIGKENFVWDDKAEEAFKRL